MANTIKRNIRFYQPNDPYTSEVDNLPLKDLLSNDEILQVQVDQLRAEIGQLTGRSTFGDLKPYVDESAPGYIFANPGSFIARVNSAPDRADGLQERRAPGMLAENDKIVKAQPEDSSYGIDGVKGWGMGRTALVRLLETNGANPSVVIPAFTTDDYPDVVEGSNSAPAYRMDIVFIEAYPAEDQDNLKPKLGVMQGGWFMESPETVNLNRKEGSRFADDAELEGRTSLQKTTEINLGNVIDEKKGGANGGFEGHKYTTTPLVEDLKNFTFRPDDCVRTPLFGEQWSDIPTADALSDWADGQLTERGTFCLPLCYVLTPFGHLEGSFIPSSNVVDIRPFFRTAELTLDERQGMVAAFRPSFTNRVMTRRDPDYRTLRDDIVKGVGSDSPGNHEGRLVSLEDRLESLGTQELVLFNSDVTLMPNQSNGTHTVIPTATVAPEGDDIVALLVRAKYRIGGGDQTSESTLRYTDNDGQSMYLTIGRVRNDLYDGRPNNYVDVASTTIPYIKEAGEGPTSMTFVASGLNSSAGGRWGIDVYGYIRKV